MIQVQYISPDGKLIEMKEMEDGATLEVAAQELFQNEEGKAPVPVVAFVGSKPALKKKGDWAIKLDSCTVQFRAIAMGGGGGGGGSDPVRIVLMVAVVALSIVAAIYAPGLLGLAAGSKGALFASAMAGSAVMMAGTFLINAICPVKNPNMSMGQIGSADAAKASPTYSLNAMGNQARLYQCEPEGFGKIKIVPDYCAQPWLEYVNNDQYGYFVFSVGRGHYEINSMQFGETVFWKDGHFVDSMYSTGSLTDPKTFEVNKQCSDTDWTEPALVGSTGDSVTAFSIVLNFPDGLCSFYLQAGKWETRTEYDSYGDYTTVKRWVDPYWAAKSHTITVDFQVREVGTDGQPVTDWMDMGSTTRTESRTSAFTHNYAVSPPYAAQWQVRAKISSPLVGTITQTTSVPQNPNSWRPTMVNRTYTTKARERVIFQSISGSTIDMGVEFIEPGRAVTLFPDNVVTANEVSGQDLFAPNDAEYKGAIGPFTTNPAGTKTTQLLFDFVFPQGIGTYNDQGSLVNTTVSWTIEYRSVDDFDNGLSDWNTLQSITLTMRTITPQRRTYKYSLPNGRYQVRCRRTNNTSSNGRTMDKIQWSALRALLPGTYAYPISAVALRLRANNSLSSNASKQFSIIATRKLPLYDRETKTWSDEVPTRSFAAAICSICKCTWGGRLTDANIDLDTLWAIDEKLQAKGWHYDSYLDGAYLVWPLIVEVCQSQAVVPRLVGPVLSFAVDEYDRPPSFALTPRNIIRNSFNVTYVTWTDDTPDDVVVDYLDEDYGYQQRDVTATLPESESAEPASMNILGIVNRKHAHKIATLYAAHNRWQRVQVECQVEGLGRIINRGDICTVAHPRFKNTAGGAVESWNEATLEVTLVPDMQRIVPEDVTPNDGWYLALTRNDGSIWGPVKLEEVSDTTVKFDSGDYSTLLLQGQENPFEWLSSGRQQLPTQWTMYSSKNYQRLMVVQSVTSQDGFKFDLSLANHDKRIYQYDNLEVPPWHGRNQRALLENVDAPGNVKVTVNSVTDVTASWLPVPSASWYEYSVSYDGSSFTEPSVCSETSINMTVPSGTFHIRVRACTDVAQSYWVYWRGDTTTPTPEEPRLSIGSPYREATAKITWEAAEYARGYGVRLVNKLGIEFYTETITEPSFVITPEMQTGGPYRDITVYVYSVGTNHNSDESSIRLTDPAPAEITDVDTELVINKQNRTATLVLNDVTPEPDDNTTGFIFAKGSSPDFNTDRIIELRQSKSLPYQWTDLEVGHHYFRIAVKDKFYDAAHNLAEMTWSAVLVVTVTLEETEQPVVE